MDSSKPDIEVKKIDDIEVTVKDTKKSEIIVLFTELLALSTEKKVLAIDEKTNVLLQTLLSKSPKSFETIAAALKEISEDGKIDYTDIPKLVLLITKLHTTDFTKVFNAKTFDNESFVSVVKTILHALIELNYIQVENKVKVYEVLDISLTLLSVSLDITLPNLKSRCC